MDIAAPHFPYSPAIFRLRPSTSPISGFPCPQAKTTDTAGTEKSDPVSAGWALPRHQPRTMMIRAMKSSTDILIEKLSSLQATFNLPTGSRRIDDTEIALSASFPAGIRDFYLRCDGIGEPTEQWWWDFFTLSTIVERTNQRRAHPTLALEDGSSIPYTDLVCFCDVLIDAPTYLFHANPHDPKFGHFYADSHGEGWLVAESYEEFVQVFSAEHDEILLGMTGKRESDASRK